MEGICRSSIRFGLLTAALLAATALPVQAAERYPTRPVRVIVPFPPGGSTDFNAGYDPVKDFMPITMISQVPTTISVHPSVPVHSVKELLELANSKPGQLIHASSGIGTNSQITGELFNLMGNTSIRAIQYKGGMESFSGTPQETIAYLKNEQVKWSRVIKDRNMKGA